MLTAKLFAGLASILALIVFLAKLRALPPVPIYLQLVAALACVIFAATYFTAARWMQTPLNQTLGLVQVGFIVISVGAFGFAVYLYPSLSSEADFASDLIVSSALGFSVGCALFAANAIWAVIRLVRVRPLNR